MRTRYPRTKKQREYRTQFYQETGFEFIDDTTQPFVDRAHWNLKWIRDHIEDAAQRMERELPKVVSEDELYR